MLIGTDFNEFTFDISRDMTWAEAEACLETDAEKQVCDANPGKSCVNVLELLQCPEEGNVACQDVYGQEYAVICENGVVTQASGVCEDGLVCYVPEGGCTTPAICGNETIGAGARRVNLRNCDWR